MPAFQPRHAPGITHSVPTPAFPSASTPLAYHWTPSMWSHPAGWDHGFTIRDSSLVVWKQPELWSLGRLRAMSLLCYLFFSLVLLSKSLPSKWPHLRWDPQYLSREVTVKVNNDNCCAWSPREVPGAVLSIVHMLDHLSLRAVIWGRNQRQPQRT